MICPRPTGIWLYPGLTITALKPTSTAARKTNDASLVARFIKPPHVGVGLLTAKTLSLFLDQSCFPYAFDLRIDLLH
jgi:hypothetical protein